MNVEDRLALHELAALYGDTIDNRNWDGLSQVFTEDAVFGNPTMPDKDLVGVAAIRRFMERSRHPLAHAITNIRVEEVDGAVTLHSVVLLPGPDRMVSAGAYTDEVVKTPEGWRIRRRSFEMRQAQAT